MTWPTALVIVACLGFVFGVLSWIGYVLSLMVRKYPPETTTGPLPTVYRLPAPPVFGRKERLH